MQFVKMHGAQNDFVFVDTTNQSVPDDPAELARAVCDRHAGIGADGLVLIGPSDTADARMRMWNADGSAAQMCGNALRCVIRHLHDQQRIDSSAAIETGHGVLVGSMDDAAGRVRVEMGRPVLQAKDIPTKLAGDPPLNHKLNIGERSFEVCSVSMGNPHCVVFNAELTDAVVRKYGPRLETCASFPERTNVEFVAIQSPEQVRVRIWERGSGETKACGTGACAVVVAGVLTNRLNRVCRVQLPGGVLDVDWTAESVFVTGPTCRVFTGIWPA